MEDPIYLLTKPDEAKVLRKKAALYDFAQYAPSETRALVKRMKKAMHEAQGIGLSANQIGLPHNVFVGQIANADGKPKFYAIFNPEIVWKSEEVSPFEEGCLSVPGVYGKVDRPEKIVLEGYNQHSKPIKIKAWGLLARMFQHEVDHLGGTVFIDKAHDVHPV